MSDIITPEIFAHLVHLAALELQSNEAEYLLKELNNQLNAIHELEAIPLKEDVVPTYHGILYTPEMSPPLRPDELSPHPNPQEIIDQAPDNEEGYVIVPDIPHIDLE